MLKGGIPLSTIQTFSLHLILLWDGYRYLSLHGPGTMSPVLNETVTSFRCIVIKDMEKLKKNETDSRALNQGYKL